MKKLLLIMGLCFVSTSSLAHTILADDIANKNSSPEKVFRFSCVVSPESDNFKYIETVLRHAFAKLGFGYEQKQVSTLEAMEGIVSGRFDGDCGRVKHVLALEHIPKLYPTTVPVFQTSIGIWGVQNDSSKIKVLPKERESLRIGYLSSMAYPPKLAERIGFKAIKSYDNHKLGMSAIRGGQLDYWIDYSSVFAGEQRQLLGDDIILKEKLVVLPVFPVFSPKYQHLLESFNDALKEAKSHVLDLNSVSEEPLSSQYFANAIRFECVLPPSNSLFYEVFRRFRESFAKLDQGFYMYSLPFKRGEQEMLAGRLDGGCARTEDFFVRNENFIKVPYEFMRVNFRAWSSSPELQLDQLSEEQLKSLKVAYVRGGYFLKNILIAKKITESDIVSSHKVGLKMLLGGRIDILVAADVTTMSALHNLHVSDSLYVAGSFEEVPIYPVITSAYEDLAESLAEELRKQEVIHGPLSDFTFPHQSQ